MFSNLCNKNIHVYTQRESVSVHLPLHFLFRILSLVESSPLQKFSNNHNPIGDCLPACTYLMKSSNKFELFAYEIPPCDALKCFFT